ncbi:MAG: hypothetical protein EOS79_08550 [Mesorhizobium sp.]|nr:MAG: hypothetical protein EOS79_08550 [Mesorhizobium sp.]
MMAVDPNEQRAKAARLADALAPLIEAHLLTEPTPQRVVERRVLVTADRLTIDAAKKVAEAINFLDQTKYAGGREVAARQALERAARSLRTQLKKREARHAPE